MKDFGGLGVLGPMTGVLWGLTWFWGGSKEEQIFGVPRRSFFYSQEVWGTLKRFLGSQEVFWV